MEREIINKGTSSVHTVPCIVWCLVVLTELKLCFGEQVINAQVPPDYIVNYFCSLFARLMRLGLSFSCTL